MTLRLLLVYWAVSSPLVAQSFAVHGRVTFPLSSSQLGIVPLDSSGNRGRLVDRGGGVWGGVALDATVAQFSATVTGLRGGLGGADGQFPKRDGGEIGAVVRYEAHPSVAIEGRHTTRVFSSAAGRQRWTLWGIGVVGSRDLGTPFLRASGGFTYVPIVRVSGEPDPRFGIAAGVALTATPRRSPLVLTAGYRIERFSFPFASDRAEQFETFTLSVGLRMRRHDGRWVFGGAGGQ